MSDDLKRTLQQHAPTPRAELDVARLIGEGSRQRRNRNLALASTAVVISVAAAFAVPAISGDATPEQNVVPAQSPSRVSPPPESTVPTPVFGKLDSAWTKLARPPEPRTDAVSVWAGRQPSGRDLILWGGESGSGVLSQNDGYSWDADTNAWSSLAQSPLAARAGAGAVFTGSEVIIWGGNGPFPELYSDGAAYNPETDTWRMLPQAPLDPAAPVATVWTGEEVLVWGSADRSAASTEGAAYNPDMNQWRRLPEAPAAINTGTAVWADGDLSQRQELIVFGAQLDHGNRSELDHAVGIAYDPASDSWRELPDVALSPHASAIAWTGKEVVAWDYILAAAAYDRVADRWRELPKVPIADAECYPTSEFIGSYVFGWFCGQAAVFDVRTDEWTAIDTPKQIVAGDPVAAGEVLLFAGATHEATSNGLWLYLPATQATATSPERELEKEFEFVPYPGSRWYAPDGEEIPKASNVINAITGPDHCGLQAAVMMHVGWPLGHDAADISEARQYLRDPEGLLGEGDGLMTTFDERAELPSRAAYTGYRTDFMELWLDEKDEAAAYLVFVDHVERWPRAQEPIACS